MSHPDRLRLTARWILPITAAPIDNGYVDIVDGRIVDIGPRTSSTTAGEDLGDVVLTPGLINAHTHLELSLFSRIEPVPQDLVGWLLHIAQHYRGLTGDDRRGRTVQAVTAGAQASLDAGVSTLGDISRFCQHTRPVLREGPLRVVSFGEVMGIGNTRHLVQERLHNAADTRWASPHLRVGLSPHAPYSIEADGIRNIVTHARAHGMQTCLHVAETIEEIQFLQTGRGRFRELLETLDVWDECIPIPRTTPIRWVCQIGALGPECLLAHANYIDDEEIDLLCATGTSVAYCPRSHSYFGHRNHPILRLIGGGVNVCVGTDSLASAPSLALLEELTEVHRVHPELACSTVLALGTINAARALGLAQSVGSLEPGKRADLAVWSWRSAPPSQRPDRSLLESDPALHRLYIDGQRIR